jgi:hypothetical protein
VQANARHRAFQPSWYHNKRSSTKWFFLPPGVLSLFF